MSSLVRKAFSRDNRFVTISILVVYPIVGLLLYLAVTEVLNPEIAAFSCGLTAVSPLLILILHFLRTGKAL